VAQVDLMLELLPLSLGCDRENALEDHIDFAKLLLIIEVSPTVLSSTWLRCRRFIFFLLMIQISSALLQIVPTCAMDLAPIS
jgi:hypothetical protein